jgi:hypothetical protein
MTLDYQNPAARAPRIPLSERVNFRLLIFIGIMAVIVGYPVYVLIDTQISGGIKHAADGYLEVNLKSMSTFTLDQTDGKLEDIPQQWRELDGKRVILRGEMWQPTGAGSDVETFDLCYSIAKCCFSGPPLVQHFVKSRAVAGKNLAYYEGPVETRGILHVKVVKDAGRVASIYQFDVDSIKPIRG